MTKIKVKIDRQDPPREVIEKYRNFDRFMDNYSKYYSTRGIRNLLYRDRKKMAMIVLIVIFILLWLFSAEDAEAITLNQLKGLL